MLLYTDVISGDELFTDASPIKEVGGAYEVDCRNVMVNDGVEVDLGANPLSEGAKQVPDVVSAHRLQAIAFDKASYTKYIKAYIKGLEGKLKETDPGRAGEFKKEASALAQKVLADFEGYEFFTGECMDPEAMVALLNYREDGVTPYLTFFKDGVSARSI